MLGKMVFVVGKTVEGTQIEGMYEVVGEEGQWKCCRLSR